MTTWHTVQDLLSLELNLLAGQWCRYVKLTTNREFTARDYVKFTLLADCRL